MAMQYADPSTDIERANMATAIRFIEGFNNDDWDSVREVVAESFVFHHPLGGTVAAGPEGMVETWTGFKQLSPDSWHPIPIMIAEGDYVAVLLPTYGTFTGHGPESPPPTGGRLDYGMVNIVRLENSKLAEMWFGMDPLVELQQMGLAPPSPPRQPSESGRDHLASFHRALATVENDYDTVAVLDNVIVAMGPDQSDPETDTRRIEIYSFDNGMPELVYSHHMSIVPPFGGTSSVAKEISEGVVDRWFAEVLQSHNASAIEDLASEHIVIHPTAMPCEAGFYGYSGAAQWIGEQWNAFRDLTVVVEHMVGHGEIVAVRWSARGTSSGTFIGQPATGKPIEFTGVSMYRLDNAEVAEIWETRNTFGILKQLNPNIGGGHSH